MVQSQGGVRTAPRGRRAPPTTGSPVSWKRSRQAGGIGSPRACSTPHWPVQVKTTLRGSKDHHSPAPPPLDSPSPSHFFPTQNYTPIPTLQAPYYHHPPSLHILQSCWAQPSRLCTAQGHLIQGDTICILDMYIYYGSFLNLEEGAPFSYSHKGTPGANSGPAILGTGQRDPTLPSSGVLLRANEEATYWSSLGDPVQRLSCKLPSQARPPHHQVVGGRAWGQARTPVKSPRLEVPQSWPVRHSGSGTVSLQGLFEH